MVLSYGRFVKISLLSWLAFLAVDFLVHAGLLAPWYARGGPGLLPLDTAFARIPAGYLAFFLLVALVVWLASRLGVRGAREGFALGFTLGIPLAASRGLGLYSITTLDPVLLLWWSVAEALELAVAGAVVGRALEVASLARLTFGVVAAALIVFAAGVALQNL